MKYLKKVAAIELRKKGYSIKSIANELSVAKSSVSVWVRNIPLSFDQLNQLKSNSFSSQAIEKRRTSRLANELSKRKRIALNAENQIKEITLNDLWLMGTMLYWAEGGKTQRMVRFSNGDPNMHLLMMKFFRIICKVPEEKMRGYIHIHDHLDFGAAENYWSDITNIPLTQFFKTFRKVSSPTPNMKNTLPYGVLDVYILDSNLFLTITGWVKGIFDKTIQPCNTD